MTGSAKVWQVPMYITVQNDRGNGYVIIALQLLIIGGMVSLL